VVAAAVIPGFSLLSAMINARRPLPWPLPERRWALVPYEL
jgi:hypothetical protein